MAQTELFVLPQILSLSVSPLFQKMTSLLIQLLRTKTDNLVLLPLFPSYLIQNPSGNPVSSSCKSYVRFDRFSSPPLQFTLTYG